jgi:hypothetical protein
MMTAKHLRRFEIVMKVVSGRHEVHINLPPAH